MSVPAQMRPTTNVSFIYSLYYSILAFSFESWDIAVVSYDTSSFGDNVVKRGHNDCSYNIYLYYHTVILILYHQYYTINTVCSVLASPLGYILLSQALHSGQSPGLYLLSCVFFFLFLFWAGGRAMKLAISRVV